MLAAGEAALDPEPLVSIVVPSFQQGRFLPFALEGLSRQTSRPVETAVFDNISTDASDDVLRLFAGRVSRIVRAKDLGQADALRTGFKESGAQVLGWLNADDMILPDTVERVSTIFQDHPEIDVVYGDCAFLSESGQFLGYFHDIQDFSTRDLLNFSDFIPQPSTFFRRSAYERVGGIDASLHYAMDWDLWCRLARAGCRFMRVKEVLAAARIHPTTKTSSGGLKRSKEVWRVNRRHAGFGIPFVAAAQLYHRYLRRYAGPFAPVARWLWSSVLRAPRSNNLVQGLGPLGMLNAGRFRVRFPVFAAARRLTLKCGRADGLIMDPPRGAFEGMHKPARASDGLVWELARPAFINEIDVSGTLQAGPSTTIQILWE
jgi:GT2 family glycosyltransferase